MEKTKNTRRTKRHPDLRLLAGRATRLAGLACLLSLVLLDVLPARADVTVDFESLPGMANSPGVATPAASQLSSQLVLADGVLFSSGAPFIAVVNLGANHATSGTRGVGGTTAAGALSYSTPIDAEFNVPGFPLEPGETDFVSVRGDLNGVNGPVTLQAFDSNGVLIATDVKTDLNGPLLEISMPGIHSASFFSATANVAFDDFTFGPVTAVPEPGLGVGLASGLALLAGLTAGSTRRGLR